MDIPSRNEIIARVFSAVFRAEDFRKGAFEAQVTSLQKSNSASFCDWSRRFHWAAQALNDPNLGKKLIDQLQTLELSKQDWIKVCARDFGVIVDENTAKSSYIGIFMVALIADLEIHTKETSGSIYQRGSAIYDVPLVEAVVSFLSGFDDHLWAQSLLYWIVETNFQSGNTERKLVADHKLDHFEKRILEAEEESSLTVPPGIISFFLLHKLKRGSYEAIPALLKIHKGLLSRNMHRTSFSVNTISNLKERIACWIKEHTRLPMDHTNVHAIIDSICFDFPAPEQERGKLSEREATELQEAYLYWLYQYLSISVNLSSLYELAKFAFGLRMPIAQKYFCQLFSAPDKEYGGFQDLSLSQKVYEKIQLAVKDKQKLSEVDCRTICEVFVTFFSDPRRGEYFMDTADYKKLAAEFRGFANFYKPVPSHSNRYSLRPAPEGEKERVEALAGEAIALGK